MGASPPTASALGRMLIEQCRRELAAAWEQVEAGRVILRNSAWLLAHWRAQAAHPAPTIVPRDDADMFITIEQERRPRRRRAAVSAQAIARSKSAARA